VTGLSAMTGRVPSPRFLAGVTLLIALGAVSPGSAHPLGNFSISQYSAIRITRDAVELRYLIDMAEIPTFQEMQDAGIVPEPGHPSLAPYLVRKAEALKEALRLEVDGQRLQLRTGAHDVIFPPGAGGLPTMKLGVVYRATLPPVAAGPSRLDYEDRNYPDRAGWKEIIAVSEAGVRITRASAPERDRSRELSDYPTDLLNDPPQDRQASVLFAREPPPPSVARSDPPAAPPMAASGTPAPPAAAPKTAARQAPGSETNPPMTRSDGAVEDPDLRLRGNRQPTPRSAFTDLVQTKDRGAAIVFIALAVAAALGAFHALEPGHGKTVVAAYLVGSRGTARDAVLLGLTVTASHTAGVYLLGGVTLYASRYVVPERLYPWLAVFSGVAIAVLGFTLFLRRYGAHKADHSHAHSHDHADTHAHPHDAADHHHGPGGHHHPHLPHREPDGAVSLPALLALGVTGGIVPCPAAVVVLLSALSLNRVGFGLLLIVAFSVGLAAVLIAIGILMVYAGRLMSRFATDSPIITHWLPLTSSVVITIVGVLIALQALVTAGILQIRLS